MFDHFWLRTRKSTKGFVCLSVRNDRVKKWKNERLCILTLLGSGPKGSMSCRKWGNFERSVCPSVLLFILLSFHLSPPPPWPLGPQVCYFRPNFSPLSPQNSPFRSQFNPRDLKLSSPLDLKSTLQARNQLFGQRLQRGQSPVEHGGTFVHHSVCPLRPEDCLKSALSGLESVLLCLKSALS